MAIETPDDLDWLTHWYGAQCDGDWEEDCGVQIDTLDNTGWSLKINLRGTSLEGVSFDPVAENLSAPDGDPAARWHTCRVTEEVFEGFGGVQDLRTLISVFRHWAEANGALRNVR